MVLDELSDSGEGLAQGINESLVASQRTPQGEVGAERSLDQRAAGPFVGQTRVERGLGFGAPALELSLIHISEPTRPY